MTTTNFLNEDKLIEAIKEKNRVGAEALYDMYAKSLFGVLFKMVKDQELAEDLLQQSFIKIWTSIDYYDVSRGKLFTWMAAIVRNLGKDSLRSKYYRQGLTTEPFELHFDYIEKHNTVTLNTDTIGIANCVSNLKAEHREILDLIYFQGYTQAEAAEKLNMPLGTLKTKCRKALCEMRGVFSEDWRPFLVH